MAGGKKEKRILGAAEIFTKFLKKLDRNCFEINLSFSQNLHFKLMI